MAEWDLFFPPGARVLALPNWRSPRLYLPAHRFSRRWGDSSFYPASRLLARLYRLSLRMRVATGLLGEARLVRSSSWPLGEFAGDLLPGTSSVVVLAGTPGPAQKITAQVRGEHGEVLGYLKYAEKPAARKRLGQEHRMLRNLPAGAGPQAVKFGPLGNGEALLATALSGKALPATLPPARGLTEFSMSLAASAPVPLEAHPWVRRARDLGAEEPDLLDRRLEALADKDWEVAVQHGDFAPWNLLRRPNGTLGAIDWEYGTLEGFPYLDVIYYVLQTSALIYRKAPLKAAEYAAVYLTQHPWLALDDAEARALIRLAAYDAYHNSREDGQPEDNKLQIWRRAIWRSTASGA